MARDGEPPTVQTGLVDLGALARAANVPGAAWTNQSDDLNANLLVFRSGEGVHAHVNAEVDVLLIGIAGEGIVEVDGVSNELRPGLALVIPKGARRGTRALSDHFAYVTCHRRRAGLWPSRKPRPDTRAESAASSGD
jgi:mannose-6-phosphate isomerase-like protein (cupin superfamily)